MPAPPFWDTTGGRRLLQRFVGHCNCATDIKEAAFLGQHDELVAAGSDDGRVFIYSSVRGASACQILPGGTSWTPSHVMHLHMPHFDAPIFSWQ